MITVKFDNQVRDFPWGRQTPHGSYRWGEYKFVFDQDLDECDYWVVEEMLPRMTTCRCPPEHTVFVTGEPPNVRTYNPMFLHQFHTVVSCHRNLIHRRVVHDQPALPWLIGMRWDGQNRRWKEEHSKDYDELSSMQDIRKDRLVSVITSDKTMTKGHRVRLDFVRRLEKELGGDLDVFITSNMGLEDKWDAIGRYRYHIALENSVCPDYWSEKLADPFLGLSYPIYYGCPNLQKYFSRDAYQSIDINDLEGSLRTIREVIYSDRREEDLEALEQAKRQVLDRYNIFPMLVELFKTLPNGSAAKRITMRPENIIRTRSARDLSMSLLGPLKGVLNR